MKIKNERSFIIDSETILANCVQYLRTLCVPGRRIEIVIRPYKHRRTKQQNRRYFAWLRFIAKEAFRIGCTDKEYGAEIWHCYYKKLFLGMRVVIDGSVHLLPDTTTEMKTVEFSDYMAQIDAWCAERGIVVPDFNESADL